MSQDCQDMLLVEIAAKEATKDSMLSFVHIVKNDDEEAHHVPEQEDRDSEIESALDEDDEFEINSRKKDYESESSDEEFEFD